MLAPSCLLSLPPSLSCSVKETVMTACQSLASCGSVCPHLHPIAPTAEQTLCSPLSLQRRLPPTLNGPAANHPHANSSVSPLSCDHTAMRIEAIFTISAHIQTYAIIKQMKRTMCCSVANLVVLFI